jgi:hypothetical protein
LHRRPVKTIQPINSSSGSRADYGSRIPLNLKIQADFEYQKIAGLRGFLNVFAAKMPGAERKVVTEALSQRDEKASANYIVDVLKAANKARDNRPVIIETGEPPHPSFEAGASG